MMVMVMMVMLMVMLMVNLKYDAGDEVTVKVFDIYCVMIVPMISLYPMF